LSNHASIFMPKEGTMRYEMGEANQHAGYRQSQVIQGVRIIWNLTKGVKIVPTDYPSIVMEHGKTTRLSVLPDSRNCGKN
jgi:hypothetical protein